MFYPPHHTRYYPPHMYPPQHYGPPSYWQQHPQQMRPHNGGTSGTGSNEAAPVSNSNNNNEANQASNSGGNQGATPPPMQHGFPPYPYPPRPTSSFMAAFKDKDGKFDFNKTSDTIDQVVKISNQISPIVKQVGSFFTSKGGGS